MCSKQSWFKHIISQLKGKIHLRDAALRSKFVEKKAMSKSRLVDHGDAVDGRGGRHGRLD